MHHPDMFQELARLHQAQLVRDAQLHRLARGERQRRRGRLLARVTGLLSRRPVEQPALRPAAKPSQL